MGISPRVILKPRLDVVPLRQAQGGRIKNQLRALPGPAARWAAIFPPGVARLTGAFEAVFVEVFIFEPVFEFLVGPF